MTDTLTIYRTKIRRQWRWKLTAANGERIGASTEGYRHRSDCIINAARVLGTSHIVILAACDDMPVHRTHQPDMEVTFDA